MNATSHKATAAQVTLSNRLRKHNAALAQRNPMRTETDLPLSTEMVELLEWNLSDFDEHGCLPENVSSVLMQPMSGISAFCPTAAILESKHTSNRMPCQHEIDDMMTRRGVTTSSFNDMERSSPFSPSFKATNASNRFNSPGFDNAFTLTSSPATHFSALPGDAYRESGMLSPSLVKTQLPGTPKIQDSRSRLEVMWLQRKAQLAKEDGKGDLAIQLLQEALDEHLGTRNYIAARLADPILSSNPQELLDNISEEFFLYDAPVHLQVAKIQRCFHKKFVRKCHMMTNIARVFRGFVARKRMRKHREIMRQCAVLIQRRFRVHLQRMHRLATRIKTWYRLMKIVHEYKRRLHLYRMARRIQRLFRGIKGRTRAAYFRLRLRSNMCIQRNARAYALRRDRAFAIHFFHKIFFHSARVIQRAVRSNQAVERAQLKLLLELARENIRSRKERILVEETIRMQKIWNGFYSNSAAGRAHLEHIDRQLRVRKDGVSEVKVALSLDEQSSQRAISVLEQFDEDGTGNFSSKRLPRVLQRLCIAANREKLLHLRTLLDPEDHGIVSITDFMEWFESEDADEFLEPDTVVENIRRLHLEFRSKLRKLHIQRHARKLQKEQHRCHSALLTKQTINTFRMAHPPKFQCCQCLQAFVMFTDYFVHFEQSSGNCGVSGQKALYFPRYWESADWAKQRQIEAEIIRINDEHPHAVHRARLRCHAEAALHSTAQLRQQQRELTSKAYELYKDDYLTRSLSDLKERTIADVQHLVGLCSGKSVSDFGLDVITRHLLLPMRAQWILEQWGSSEQLVQWLEERLPQQLAAADLAAGVEVTPKKRGASAAQPQSPGSSKKMQSGKQSPSASSSKKSLPKTAEPSDSNNEGVDSSSVAHKSMLGLDKVRAPKLTDSGRIKRRCWELAKLHVNFLRVMQAEAQAQLMALLEFRARRPRKITISDSELESLQLFSLRRQHYDSVQSMLIERLRAIDQQYIRLYSKALPRRCAPLKSMFSKYRAIAPTEGEGFIDREALFAKATAAAEAQASALLAGRMQSAIGKLVLRHLARDLKSSRHLLLSTALNSADEDATVTTTRNIRTETSAKFDIFPHSRSSRLFSFRGGGDVSIAGRSNLNPLLESLDLLFQYGKFSSALVDEGINPNDLPLVAKQFALALPETQMKIIIDQLDPESSGSIGYKWFVSWMQSPQSHKYHSTYRSICNSMLRWARSALRRKYTAHAQDALLIRTRNIARLEVAVREHILRSGVDEVLLQRTVRDFLLRAESGEVGAVLNSRRFHRLHSELNIDDMKRRVEQLNSELEDPAAASGAIVHDAVDVSDEYAVNAQLEVEEESEGDPPIPLTLNGTAVAATIETNAAAVASEAVAVGDDDHSSIGTPADIIGSASPQQSEQNEQNSDPLVLEDGAVVAGEQVQLPNAPARFWDITAFRFKPVSSQSSPPKTNAAAAVAAAERNIPQSYTPKLTGNLYESWRKLSTLLWKEEDAEHKVFYELVEDQAEARYWRDIFSATARYKLLTERKLLSSMDEMVDAFGFCLPPLTATAAATSTVESEAKPLIAGFPRLRWQQQSPADAESAAESSVESHSLESAIPNNQLAEDEGENDDHRSDDNQEPAEITAVERVGVLQLEPSQLELEDGERLRTGGHALEQNSLMSDDAPIQYNTSPLSSQHNINSIAHRAKPRSSNTAAALQQSRAAQSLYESALQAVVSAFDTDCTGDFDEVEVRTVLRCLRCTMSERVFRLTFGGTDDAPTCVSVHKLVQQLSARVQWQQTNSSFTMIQISSIESTTGAAAAVIASLFDRFCSCVGASPTSASESASDAAGEKRNIGLLVRKRSELYCALRMLVTIQRQQAQERAMQTVKLSRMGRVEVLREAKAGSSLLTLLSRSQLLAMRQTDLFLQTTHGRIKLYLLMRDVEFSWQQDIVSPCENASICTAGARTLPMLPSLELAAGGGSSSSIGFFTGQMSSSLIDGSGNSSNSLLRYAFMLHREENGVLSTELPHVVKFLVTRLHLQPTPTISELLAPFVTFQGTGGIRWLGFEEFLSLLKPAFFAPEWPPTSMELSHVPYQSQWSLFSAGANGKPKKHTRVDAVLRMKSVARQQAVLIAMNFQHINVPETNYRCSILGLQLFMRRHLGFSVLKAKKLSAVQLSNRDARFELDVDWATIPREAAVVYLLAHGYSESDLTHPALATAAAVEVEHQHGRLCSDLVSVSSLREAANEAVAKSSSYYQQLLRSYRCIRNYHTRMHEFKGIVRALVLYPHRVDKLGAEFLKEILLGISHCQS